MKGFTLITTKDLVSMLKAEVNFKCSSAMGAKETRNNVNVYVVYSYTTIIAIKKGNKWILNTQKYSQTTSRLQNAVGKAAGEVIPCTSEEEFQDCVYKEFKVTI